MSLLPLTLPTPHDVMNRPDDFDALAATVALGSKAASIAAAAAVHREARRRGCAPGSIHGLYRAIGRGDVPGTFTVPAMNLRVLTYDTARAAFRAARELNAGAMLFELARSEMGYTAQRPREYAALILAAALREGHEGPVFIQGDHFQASPSRWPKDPQTEEGALRDLVDEALAAGYLNVDLDASTLVDLSRPTLREQQRTNAEVSVRLTEHVRRREPGVPVSIGVEIGEVGHKNSTPEELRAFMDEYASILPAGLEGPSKISVQTGTSHGGTVLAGGEIAEAKVDFAALGELTRIARAEYGMGGAVQHGASTLPDRSFHLFPEAGCVEIHLATGFQNLVLDHPSLPEALRRQVAEYVTANHAAQRKAGETEAQFQYKNRKYALGPLKAPFWDLPEPVRDRIGRDLEAKFSFLFRELRVGRTLEWTRRHGLVPEHDPLAEATEADLGNLLEGE